MQALRSLLIAVFLLVVTISVGAQSLQTRTLVHVTFDMDQRWFITAWMIGNIQDTKADNLNLLAGIGRRLGKGNIEVVFQQHWNIAGNQQLVDVRVNQDLGTKWSLYAEAGSFLNRLALYDFASLEASLTPKLNLGGETENVHQRGRDSIGGGPRVTYLLKSWPHAKLVLTGSYQFRPNEPNIVRAYLIVHLHKSKT